MARGETEAVERAAHTPSLASSSGLIPKPPMPPPWRDRAPRIGKLAGRCCWVCGKNGGWGFTVALRLAGYRMAHREMGYAHPACMMKAQREADAHAKAKGEA